MRDAGRLEAEPVELGRRPVATSRWLPSMRSLAGVAVQRSPATLAAGRFDARDRDAAAQRDAFARELVEHDARAFGILARERLRRFEHRHRGAEPAVRLRQLEPDRARRR